MRDVGPQAAAFRSSIDSLSGTARMKTSHLPAALKHVRPFIFIERFVNPTERIGSRRRNADKKWTESSLKYFTKRPPDSYCSSFSVLSFPHCELCIALIPTLNLGQKSLSKYPLQTLYCCSAEVITLTC